MGRSYFNGTETDLYFGSLVFQTKTTAQPGLYGLTPEQAASFAAAAVAFRDSVDVAVAPQTGTPSTVIAKNDAKRPLKLLASQLAKIIAGTATVSDGQRSELGLSVRAKPSPIAPPGSATSFSVDLDGNGDIKLEWKCKHPRGSVGVMYQVFRQLDRSGRFEFVGGVGRRKFVDATVPAGTKQIIYEIRAVRGTKSGSPSQFNVQFGKKICNAATSPTMGIDQRRAA